MKTTNELLTDDILEIIARFPEETRLHYKYGLSISYLIELLQDMGWKNLGNQARFESKLQDLGFELAPLLKNDGTPVAGYRYGVTL